MIDPSTLRGALQTIDALFPDAKLSERFNSLNQKFSSGFKTDFEKLLAHGEALNLLVLNRCLTGIYLEEFKRHVERQSKSGEILLNAIKLKENIGKPNLAGVVKGGSEQEKEVAYQIGLSEGLKSDFGRYDLNASKAFDTIFAEANKLFDSLEVS